MPENVKFVQILNEKGELVNNGLKSSLKDEEMVALMKDLVWGRTVNKRLVLAWSSRSYWEPTSIRRYGSISISNIVCD